TPTLPDMSAAWKYASTGFPAAGSPENVPTYVPGGSVVDADACISTSVHVPAPGPACVTSATTRPMPLLPVPASVTRAVTVTVCRLTVGLDGRIVGATLSGSVGEP